LTGASSAGSAVDLMEAESSEAEACQGAKPACGGAAHRASGDARLSTGYGRALDRLSASEKDASMRSTAWCVAERGGAGPVEKVRSLLSDREIVQFVSCPRKRCPRKRGLMGQSRISRSAIFRLADFGATNGNWDRGRDHRRLRVHRRRRSQLLFFDAEGSGGGLAEGQVRTLPRVHGRACRYRRFGRDAGRPPSFCAVNEYSAVGGFEAGYRGPSRVSRRDFGIECQSIAGQTRRSALDSDPRDARRPRHGGRVESCGSVRASLGFRKRPRRRDATRTRRCAHI